LFEDLFKSEIPAGDELRSMIKGGRTDTATGQPAAETAPFIQQQHAATSALNLTRRDEA
jgi:hypothetical protein